MPQRTKNQHYVAQLYLRQFAFERRKKVARIHVFDKTRQHAFATNIRNVAAELNFYEESDTGIEKAFQRVEDLFVPAYRQLLEKETEDALTVEQRAAVAAFVALQQVRTNENRHMTESLISLIRDHMANQGMPLDLLAQVEMLRPELIRESHVNQIRHTVPTIAEIIVQMKWVLLLNETSTAYWTSDHPVSMYNEPPTGLEGNRGWKCRGIQAFFPLSPTRALCICDPETYRELPSVLRTSDVKTVIFQNHLQIQSSTRYLYASHGDFRFATQVLADQPFYANPRRQRTSIADGHVSVK